MNKVKNCSNCGNEIDIKAVVCPSCGCSVKTKKPIWKKWWVWVAAVIVIVVIASSGGSETPVDKNNPNIVEETITYEAIEVSQMIDDLESNALASEQKYLDKYLQISGRLGTIDSDGSYICLEPTNNEFSFTNVQCRIKNEDQKAHVATLNKGDLLTIKVKVKSIGEVLGYTVDIIEFVE